MNQTESDLEPLEPTEIAEQQTLPDDVLEAIAAGFYRTTSPTPTASTAKRTETPEEKFDRLFKYDVKDFEGMFIEGSKDENPFEGLTRQPKASN